MTSRDSSFLSFKENCSRAGEYKDMTLDRPPLYSSPAHCFLIKECGRWAGKEVTGSLSPISTRGEREGEDTTFLLRDNHSLGQRFDHSWHTWEHWGALLLQGIVVTF